MAKQSTTPPSRRPVPTSRTVATRRKSQEADRTDITWDFPLAKQNLIGIGAGILLIVIGYLCMSTGMVPREQAASNDGIWNNSLAVTVAPILLVLGYCVIIPFFLLYRFNKQNGDGTPQTREMVGG